MFDFIRRLFGLKPKPKMVTVGVTGFISDNADGLSHREATKVRDEFLEIADDSADESSMFNAATDLLLKKRYREAIEALANTASKYPDKLADCALNQGACYFFLSEYEKAIEHYLTALAEGFDRDQVDDNVWEAVEALIVRTGDKEKVALYFEAFPDGNHVKSARGIFD